MVDRESTQVLEKAQVDRERARGERNRARVREKGKVKAEGQEVKAGVKLG